MYTFVNSNFQSQNEDTFPSHLVNNQISYLFNPTNTFVPIINPIMNRRKRLTKRLSCIEMKKKIHALNSDFKIMRKTFKYFDPSRAPPITSLRLSQ